MAMIPPHAAVGDSNLGIETSETVFSVMAFGPRIEFRLPAGLLAELPSPILPAAEIDDRGPADVVLSVRLNHTGEGDLLGKRPTH